MQMADGTTVSAVGYMVQLKIDGLKVDEWVKVDGVTMKYPSSRVLLGRLPVHAPVSAYNL